jgi:2-amino-4-hydroxy-6-hydroxymethyldihydropteridine diphosphokinase
MCFHALCVEMGHIVYLALGSNLGDRLANLREAIAAMPPDVVVLQQSRVYETPPWGYADQPAFLNMALKSETALSPLDLLKYLKRLESALGRTPTFHYGPRKIDLDILFYDDLVMETPELVVPHPRLHERAFVLVPLADVAAEFVHPILKQTINEQLQQVDSDEIRLVPGIYKVLRK